MQTDSGFKPEKKLGPLRLGSRQGFTTLLNGLTLTPNRANYLARFPIPNLIRYRLAQKLRAFGYHKSARRVIKVRPLSSYPKKYHPKIAAIAAQTTPDAEAEALMSATMEQLVNVPNASIWRALMRWYSMQSSLPDQDRIDTIARLSKLSSDKSNQSLAEKMTIAKAQIRVHQSSGRLIDIKQLIPELPKNKKDAVHLEWFISQLRIHGFADQAYAIAQQVSGGQHVTYVRMMLHNFPMQIDVSAVSIGSQTKQRLSFLDALQPLIGLSPEHGNLFAQTVRQTVERFPAERIKNQERILATFMRLGLQDEAIVCLNNSANPQIEVLISARVLRAWEQYYQFNFSGAAEAFEAILQESPKQPEALVGYRFSLSRIGMSMSEVYDKISEISGQIPADGEVNFWRLYEGGLFEKLGRDAAQANRWKPICNYLGDRYVLDWPTEPRLDKSLFYIADQGVGDEIRQLRFYKELTRIFGKVDVTCDPRLQTILEFNFSDITFHPVWRSRIGLVDRLNKMDNRIEGFNGGLYNTLTEEMRPLVDSADFVGNHFSLLAANTDAPSKIVNHGPIIQLPTEDLKPVHGKPLRVGLLWRSGLVRGSRRLMYLSIDDLAPLMDVKDVEFHALQHDLTVHERAFCQSRGIVMRKDIDLYNDFDALAGYLSSLGLVIGISTVPAELAASLGVPVWFLGFSPENLRIRSLGGTTEKDQLTVNATVISPKVQNYDRSPQDCIADVVGETFGRLKETAAAHALK